MILSDSINFGLVAPGESRNQTIWVRNTSRESDLFVEVIVPTNPVFTIFPKQRTIPPLDSAEFLVIFTPLESQVSYEDSLFVRSSERVQKIILNGLGGKVVVDVSPLPNAIGVPADTVISARLDFPVIPESVTSENVVVYGNYTGYVPLAQVVYDSLTKEITIFPSHHFMSGEVITVTLTSNLESNFHQPILSSYSWQFTVATDAHNVSFTRTAGYFTEPNPWRVIPADLDNDGDLDLAVAHNLENGRVTVWENNGQGQFSQVNSIPVGQFLWALIALDVDRDGDLDLMVDTNTNQVAVLLNEGNFSFQTVPITLSSFYPKTLESGDWNGDGFMDIAAITTGNPGKAAILWNDGEGHLVLNSYYLLGVIPIAASVSDMNNDGYLDLIVANQESQFLSLLLNNTEGRFENLQAPGVGAFPRDVLSRDFDMDGMPDVATAHWTDPGFVSVFKKFTSGTFLSFDRVQTGVATNSLWSADIDGDGDLDLLAANSNIQENNISVLRNNGRGTFRLIASPFAGVQPLSVVGGDFDLDGDIDLATVSTWQNQLTIISNIGTVSQIEPEVEIIDHYQLFQNYPNPFNPETAISYQLPAVSQVQLAIYNTIGQRIRTLVNERQAAGRYTVLWDGRDDAGQEVSSGVYLYRLVAGKFSRTHRMLLLR